MSFLGDVEINVVKTENIDYRNEVTSKPVEDGAEIGDHINHKPVELSIDFTIAGLDAEDRRDKLQDIRDSDQVFDYTDVKELRTYPNMAITSLSISNAVDVANGFRGSMSLKQIRIAEQETATINLGKDPVTGKQAQADAGESEKRDSNSEEVDENTSDDSFLYSIGKVFNIGGDSNGSS